MCKTINYSTGRWTGFGKFERVTFVYLLNGPIPTQYPSTKDFYRFNLPQCYVSQKQENNLLAQGSGIHLIPPFTTSF